jgi:hypothetical protein
MAAAIFGGLITIFIFAVSFAQAQAPTPDRPPVGGIGQLPDAMIFYVAHGAKGACGPGCSEWIAAEGAVKWDTHKRLINILDRTAGRKLPVVINAWGDSSFNVATSLGRLLRGRGIDTTMGPTEVEACRGKSEADCFALKRQGGPLDATVKVPDNPCDNACVLILAGGVHRSLPAGSKVMLTGMGVHNRLGLNMTKDEQTGATARFDELFRIYLREMGVGTEILDLMDKATNIRRRIELPPADWTRLRLVTETAL